MAIIDKSKFANLGNEVELANLTVANKVVLLDIAKIKTNPNNFYEINKIEELKNSILADGQIEALLVDENYQLISGHRRLEALKLASSDVAKVIVLTNLNELTKQIMLIQANSYRIKTVYELAKETASLKELLMLKKKEDPEYQVNINKEVAQILAKSETQIKQYSNIAQLSENDIAELEEINISSVKDLAKIGKIKKETKEEVESIVKQLKIDENANFVEIKLKDVPINYKRIKVEEFVKKLKLVHPDDLDSLILNIYEILSVEQQSKIKMKFGEIK